MNKEEFDINQELEQMRRDYADLKERFDKQQIINDHLMEKAFKADVRWLSWDKNSAIIASALGIPTCIVLSIIKKLEWWIPVAGTLFVLIVLWAMLRLYRNLSQDTLYTEDVLSATKKVKRFKMQYQRFFFASYSAAVILFGSYLPTIYHSWSDPAQGTKMVAIGCILLVSLFVLGYLYYKRLMKACNSILERLESK